MSPYLRASRLKRAASIIYIYRETKFLGMKIKRRDRYSRKERNLFGRFGDNGAPGDRQNALKATKRIKNRNVQLEDPRARLRYVAE